MPAIKLRDLFVWITSAFWIAAGYYAVRCPNPAAHGAHDGRPAAKASAGGLRVARKPGLPNLGAAELARHASPSDCWIAIAGTVYDLTGYVDLHPSKHQEMDAACGKEGTASWDIKESGKDRGQPHTKRAAEFLEEYPQMGVLQQ